MRKFLGVILLTSFLFTLSSCASQPTEKKQSPQPAVQTQQSNEKSASQQQQSPQTKAVTTPQPTTTPTVTKPSPQPVEKKDITVYVTKTGKKYHRNGCRYLSKSQIPMSLSDAKAAGYGPCSVCNPPY